MTEPDWRRDAACAGAYPDLFYPPCPHPGVTSGETCPVCFGVAIVPRPQWSSSPARKICRTCPVQLECLTEASNTGEVYGVWGGAAGKILRVLAQTRRAAGHDYRRGCGCDFCRTVAAVLGSVDRPNANTDNATHGRKATYVAGCRCTLCRFRVTITGNLLNRVGWDTPEWWIYHRLPINNQARTLTKARRVAAAEFAANIRSLMNRAGISLDDLYERIPADVYLPRPTVNRIVTFHTAKRVGPTHLSLRTAEVFAVALEATLDDITDPP